MNDKTLISFVVVFIISVITFISYSTLNSETFGDEFVNQVRIADSEDTLNTLSDSDLVNLGKEICLNAESWNTEILSIEIITSQINNFGIKINQDNRIVPILRFQSTYELCPENISILENLFISNE
tara:strand:+ start:27666 stop:28043 length:378 start_codon:yes stop_codon:yes gene_type:complete